MLLLFYQKKRADLDQVVRKGFRPEAWHFAWDHRDRLVAARSDNGEAWAYAYDPFGRRVSKRCVAGKQAGAATAYLWDGDAMIEARTTASGETIETTRYFYDPETLRPAAQEVNGELQYIVCDHLGTPTELFTQDGDLLWSRKARLWEDLCVMAGFPAMREWVIVFARY